MDPAWAPVPHVAPVAGSTESLPRAGADVASRSWFSRKPREAPPVARPPAIRPAPAAWAAQSVPAPVAELRAAPPPVDGSPDAHLRRTLALVELSRLVIDGD